MAQLDCRDGFGGTFTASSTVLEILLDSKREWTIHHTGRSSSGADSTNTIYLQLDGSAPQLTYADRRGKIPLEAGRSYPIKKGTSSVQVQCVAGEQASFVIVDGSRVAGAPSY